MSQSKEQTDIKDGKISLPEFLYYFNKKKSDNISPDARLNPVSLVEDGDAWENSTSPSMQPNKKTLVFCSDSLSSSLSLGEKFAFIARLKNEGFSIYVKNGIGDFTEFTSPSPGGLNLSKSAGEDYKELAKRPGLVRDETIILTRFQTDEVNKSLEKMQATSEKVISSFQTALDTIKELQDKQEIHELITKHEDKIQDGRGLASIITALNGTKYEGLIHELITKHEGKIRHGFDLASIITALNSTKYEGLIHELITKHEGKIRHGSDLASIITALNGTKYEELIQELITKHEDKIQVTDRFSMRSGLPDVIKALNGTEYEGLIHELITKHEDKIQDARDLASIIKALNGTKYEELIQELITKHEDKIQDARDLASIITALNGTKYEGLIQEFITKHEDKIQDGIDLAPIITALNGTKYEGLIQELITKHEDKIQEANRLSMRAGLPDVITALNGTKYEGLIQELITKHEDKIQEMYDLTYLIKALNGTQHEGLIHELITKHEDKIKNGTDISNYLHALDGLEIMDEIAGRFLKPSISLTEHNVKYMPRKFRRVYEALHPNDDYDNKETNESKTFLHIGNLNDNYDCYYGTKDTLAAEIICADNPTLVNQFLRNVPNLQYLSLPNNLANQSFKTNAAIDYQDYSNYGNYALQERIRAIKPLDNDRGATFSMRGGTAQPSDHSNQSKKSANNIFIQPGSTESSIARVGEKQKYNMVPAGEVLNNNHITPEIRTCVIKYNNILENLQQEEYLPTNFTNVGLKNLSDTQIDGYKTHPNNNYTYYLFNQEIKAGGTYRLLSASANEEFMGVKSTNDAQISLYKGDDDFLYATSDKDCEISHVTRVKQTGGFNLLPPNDKVKQIVTDYLAKTGDPDSDPEYTAIGHKKYMEELYTSGDGTCRHKVAAVTYKLLMEEVQEEDIRTVRINGNHVKIEIRHNENWIPVELGGSDTEITYDIAGKYSPSTSAIPQNPQPQKNFAIKAANPGGTDGEITYDTEGKYFPSTLNYDQEAFLAQSEGSNKNKILVVAETNLDQHANAILKQATDNRRLVYYIDSPDKINLGKRSIAIEDTGGELNVNVRTDGLFADFIKYSGLKPSGPNEKNPLLVTNWSKFSPKERLRLNTLFEPEPSINGKPFPGNVQIIGFCDKKPGDGSFLSRHNLVCEANVSFPRNAIASKPAAQAIIDIQGQTNWRDVLFGPISVINNKMVWNKSKFTNDILGSNGPQNFELVNLSAEAIKEFEYEYDQAKALGKFIYNGYEIPLSPNVTISCATKPFDFSKFVEQTITCGITANNAPSGAELINSHLFDRLLHGKHIENGSYTETPGLIASCNGKLKLFITSPLSTSQWYCLLYRANAADVKLDLNLAPGVEVPKGLKTTAMGAANTNLKIDGSGDNPGKVKTLPAVYVSNDANKIATRLKDDAYAIIHIEDYNYGDLMGGIDFQLNGNSLENVSEKIKPLIEALKSQKIILQGTFSPDLLQLLHPLLSAVPPYENLANNLTVILEDPSILESSQPYAPLSFLSDTYNIEHHAIKENGNNVPNAYQETADKSLDLEGSEKKSKEFINTRKEKFMEFLSNNSMLQLIGHTAVGKSSLIKIFEKEKATNNIGVYRELDRFEDWANNKDDKTKILFIDESNIEDKHFTMFAPLKQGGNKRILYKGKFHELDGKHKVVFAHNPKEYGGGRCGQKLFEGNDIAEMNMDDFPACYIYEKILKASVYDKANPKMQAALNTDKSIGYNDLSSEQEAAENKQAFEGISKGLIKKYYEKNKESPNSLTVRELQEQLLQLLSDGHDQANHTKKFEGLETDNFISTSATKEAEEILDKCISIRQKQRVGLLPSKAVGVNGALFEGDSGLGKTEMIRAMLRAKDIRAANDPENAVDAQVYYKIDATMSLEQKTGIIIKAFEGGHIIWIDEINSCIDDGLEKVLNAALTGIHPGTGEKSGKSGFMLLATMNQISEEGRSGISPALKHRLTHKILKPLSKYGEDDLKKIIKLCDPNGVHISPEGTTTDRYKELREVLLQKDSGGIRNLKNYIKNEAEANIAMARTPLPFLEVTTPGKGTNLLGAPIVDLATLNTGQPASIMNSVNNIPKKKYESNLATSEKKGVDRVSNSRTIDALDLSVLPPSNSVAAAAQDENSRQRTRSNSAAVSSIMPYIATSIASAKEIPSKMSAAITAIKPNQSFFK